MVETRRSQRIPEEAIRAMAAMDADGATWIEMSVPLADELFPDILWMAIDAHVAAANER